MLFGFVPVVKIAGAFQHNIATRPIQLVHIIGREHLDLAAAQIKGAIANGDFVRITAMDRVIFDQMRSSGQRPRRIDLNNFNIVTQRLRDMRQSAAPDAAKPVDAYFYRHFRILEISNF